MNSKDAQEALKQIKENQRSSQLVGRSEAGCFLIIWGIVWLVGFLLSHQAPPFSLGWMWLILCSIGSGFSAIVGVRLGRKVHYTRTGPALGWFYPVLVGFGGLWLFLAEPMKWEQTAVIAISIVGFATVVNGILLKQQMLAWAGFMGTVVAVLIYLLLLPQFGLLIGLLGGGGMLLAGLAMQVRG